MPRIVDVSKIVLALALSGLGFTRVRGAEFTPLLPMDCPAVLGSSEPFSGAWRAERLLDGQAKTEFASASQGVGTHVDFDFGQPVLLAGFRHVDRRDPATVHAARLVFSAERDFHAPLASVPVEHADTSGGVTMAAFPAVTARYVRWEVTAINAAGHRAVGGAEIEFFTTADRETLPRREVVTIRPEQLLLTREGKLVQPVTVTVEHRYAEAVRASLEMEGRAPLALDLSFGKQTAEITLPAVQADAPLEAVLKAGGQEAARGQVLRRPVRPWTIYLLPHSHVDIGYTTLQPDVERKQINNLKTAMRLARQTADYPPGARFKWNVEVMWPVDCYLRRATAAERSALLDAIRAGQVHLEGLYGNMLTGLSRPEEQMRTMDRGLEVAQACGLPLESAMISDVPGYTWGTAVAMAQAGVKYFSFGPNWFGRMGYTMVTWQDKPFYWETPDGRSRVLCWCPHMGYALGHILGSEGLPGYLPGYLAERAEEDYPYDITYLRWNVNGDNGAPDESLSDVVRKWNDEHVAPKLVIATTSEAFRALESRYGKQLPVFRGDFTPYWEDGAASSAQETALNRASADRLVQAETLWAVLRPREFRDGDFAEAWRNVLLYSEHTWGSHDSCHVPDRPLVRDEWRIKQSYAADADRQSRELLAGVVNSPGLTTANNRVSTFTVFNTNSWPRTDLVVLPKELHLPGSRVEDAAGHVVPSQRLAGGDFAFLARDVPPLAGKPFVIQAGPPPAPGRLKVDGTTLSGRDLELSIDPRTGAIASLHSRTLGVELVDPAADTQLNDYLYLPGHDPKDVQRSGPVTISIKERGPLVASLLIESEAPGCNRLSREVRLIDGLDRVEIINRVDKKAVRAKEGVHFGFGFNVPEAQVRLDVGWAVIRPNADQLPGSCRNWFSVQRFVDVCGPKYGVTWAPLDAPIVEIGRITGTLCGTPQEPESYLASHPADWMDRALESPTLYSFVMNNHWGTNYCADQQGLVEFRYWIRPHGEYSPLAAAQFGAEASQPLLASVGAQPEAAEPRLTVSAPGVIVTSLRPSRDGQALVVRLFGAGGGAEKATLRWASPAPKATWISDLSERPLAPAGDAIDVPAWGVVTLRAEMP